MQLFLRSGKRWSHVDDLSSNALDGLIADLGDIPVVTDLKVVRRRSRDFFWYSPILNAQLDGKSADLVVSPRDENDVIRTAAACARRRVPITVQAGGTGNYGQAVPLQGGVLLDMTALADIDWIKPGLLRVGAGAKLNVIDAETQAQGFELRMHPSTRRTATIGGFVAGGSGGIGSVTYGGLRERGNILAARIVTVEEEPRVIELRGDAAQKVNRAYGTTGIITALEMPLAPAWKWIDVVVAFDDLVEAAAFGFETALADGIVKKLLSPITWPLPSYFGALRPHCPEGKSLLIAMIAEPSLESFKALLGARGTITLEMPTDDSPGQVPLYEYTWNHTTLQVLKSDRTVTYLQCLYPHDGLVEKIAEMRNCFRTRCCSISSLSASAAVLRAAGCRSFATAMPIASTRLFGCMNRMRSISPIRMSTPWRTAAATIAPMPINLDSNMRSIRMACLIPARCGAL